MNTTKDECPECGDFSTLQYDDGTLECANCRLIFYPFNEEALAFEEWNDAVTNKSFLSLTSIPLKP